MNVPPGGVLLGAIADDFTGATDLCNTLVRRGMRTVQLIGVPADRRAVREADAVVVALKIAHDPGRRGGRDEPRRARLAARAGARQIFFKYCSTFDFDRRGQYRAGRRCVARRARRRLHACLPGLSRERPHDLSRAICSSATCCCRNRACATIR